MGSEQAREARALTSLFVMALVACGGRYASVSGSDSGGVSSVGGAGTSGSPEGVRPSVGGSPDRPATGSGGTVTSGVGMAGTGMGMSTGGATVGSGGASWVLPPEDIALCDDYCDALETACPGEPFLCSKQCMSILASSRGGCAWTKRKGYACLIDAIRPAMSCADARLAAGELCSSNDWQPPDCSPTDGCDFVYEVQGLGCHSVWACKTERAELRCTEGGGLYSCVCLANGLQAFSVNGPGSATDSCLDEALLNDCAAQL